MKKPLSEVIVLDLTRVLAGPYCTMLLSDLGARIIKVERPDGGDDSRTFGPFLNDKSAYYVSLNRGKESITIDMKAKEGKELILKLVGKVDVLVENFRPGTMEKLGLGYEELKKVNPRLIYAASSGFGHTGPMSDKPSYDMIVQAMGGIMSLTGIEGQPPVRVGASIGDIFAGVFTAVGINAALFQRSITNEGQKIDVAMLDGQLAILENALVRYAVDKKSPVPLGTRHPTITPFQAFKTSDEWIIVAVGNEKLWKIFCQAIDQPGLLRDDRFATNKLRTENLQILIPILEDIFVQKPYVYWAQCLEKAEVPYTPIANIAQVMENPQLQARQMFVKVKDKQMGELTIAGNPIKMSSIEETGYRNPAPDLGENTDLILEKLLGMNSEEIQKLKEKQVI